MMSGQSDDGGNGKIKIRLDDCAQELTYALNDTAREKQAFDKSFTRVNDDLFSSRRR